MPRQFQLCHATSWKRARSLAKSPYSTVVWSSSRKTSSEADRGTVQYRRRVTLKAFASVQSWLERFVILSQTRNRFPKRHVNRVLASSVVVGVVNVRW